MMIDAHQHFWRIARGDYGWLQPSLGAIYRDFGPDDLAPVLVRHGIGRTILVQAAPTLAETEYLLAIARDTPFVAGVVGWVDFDAADAVRTIATLAADPLLVGLRPMVQDIADDDWLTRRKHAPVFEAMIAHGLVFDALVLPRHLRRLQEVLVRHPGLAVVVDHAAKPRIRDGEIDPWHRDLASVAVHAQVSCKLSGFLTEAPADAGDGVLAPYIDVLLDRFGPQRMIWGSDWPVVELAGGYDRWRAMTLRKLAALDESERISILGENARRVYLQRAGSVKVAE